MYLFFFSHVLHAAALNFFWYSMKELSRIIWFSYYLFSSVICFCRVTGSVLSIHWNELWILMCRFLFRWDALSSFDYSFDWLAIAFVLLHLGSGLYSALMDLKVFKHVPSLAYVDYMCLDSVSRLCRCLESLESISGLYCCWESLEPIFGLYGCWESVEPIIGLYGCWAFAVNVLRVDYIEFLVRAPASML